MTSCRPGLVPTTKSYVVRRLDSVEQDIILLKKAVGADCLARVSLYGKINDDIVRGCSVESNIYGCRALQMSV